MESAGTRHRHGRLSPTPPRSANGSRPRSSSPRNCSRSARPSDTPSPKCWKCSSKGAGSASRSGHCTASRRRTSSPVALAQIGGVLDLIEDIGMVLDRQPGGQDEAADDRRRRLHGCRRPKSQGADDQGEGDYHCGRFHGLQRNRFKASPGDHWVLRGGGGREGFLSVHPRIRRLP